MDQKRHENFYCRKEKVMKKVALLLVFICILAMLLFAVSCGKTDETTAEETTTEEITSEVTTVEETTTEEITTEATTLAEVGKKDPEVTAVSTIINVHNALTKSTHTDENGKTLPYRLYLPKDYSEDIAYPVMLFLHGAGERGTDNASQLNNVIQKLYNDRNSPFYQCILIVPQCPADEQWVDTPWANGNYRLDNIPMSSALTAALDLLDYVIETYSVNEARQYVMGISMGGYGTWDLLMRYPERFAAAIPICGAADRTRAASLVNVPIWTFHDSTDTVVPYSGTKIMVSAIRSAGGTVIKYTETARYGHSVWDSAVATDGLFDWLFSQRKDIAS